VGGLTIKEPSVATGIVPGHSLLVPVQETRGGIYRPRTCC